MAARHELGLAAGPVIPKQFDRRVIPEPVLDFVRACQSRIPCHLAGGAALAGAWLGHRLSRDIDLFCHDKDDHRDLVRILPHVALELGGTLTLLRDSGSHVRARLDFNGGEVEVDAVHESLPDIEEPPAPIEHIVIESLTDLRASKITCLLSRNEPRDLVDLLFLERAGFPPEQDLQLALRKDAGIDPAVLGWLLAQFPTEPLPQMLAPLTSGELQKYRDDLAARFKRIALGG